MNMTTGSEFTRRMGEATKMVWSFSQGKRKDADFARIIELSISLVTTPTYLAGGVLASGLQGIHALTGGDNSRSRREMRRKVEKTAEGSHS